MEILFYLSNGTCASKLPNNNNLFFIKEMKRVENGSSTFYYEGDQILYDIDSLCVSLYDLFQIKIFKTRDYYQNLDLLPYGIIHAGLDSDCDISKEKFERYFSEKLFSEPIDSKKSCQKQTIENLEELNDLKYQYAYNADCQCLINTLQELILSSNDSFVGFYKLLCTIPGQVDFVDDYYAINNQGRLAFNMLYSLIIQVYSILDIMTKIVYELEHLKESYKTYHKLSSQKILYGDKKRLLIDVKGTVFEKCRTLSIFENLRNEIIHNATWEMHSKVFFKMDGNNVIDRTIYFPDFTKEGTLVTYKNRKRFFAQGKKVNKELPKLYTEVLNRIYFTLNKILLNQNNRNKFYR